MPFVSDHSSPDLDAAWLAACLAVHTDTRKWLSEEEARRNWLRERSAPKHSGKDAREDVTASSRNNAEQRLAELSHADPVCIPCDSVGLSHVSAPAACSEETESASSASSRSEGDAAEDAAREAEAEPDFLSVAATAARTGTVEPDEWAQCASHLAERFRARPTLPADLANAAKSFTEVERAVRLPLYSCPFVGCSHASDDRLGFLRHL